MSWPALTELVKAIDVSKHQNSTWDDPDPTPGRINWSVLHAAHPEIQIAMIRLAGSSSGIDPDFAYNYSEAEGVEMKPIPYVNINPGLSLATLASWWRMGLGTRQPKCLMLDCETDQGQPAATITTHVKACDAQLGNLRPDAAHLTYSAGWWWDGKIVHGWEGGLRLIVAHYPYLVPVGSDYRVAYTFEEADRCLPIGNNFTPRLCKGTTTEQTVGWQFTSKGRLSGIVPPADLDYFKRWWVDEIFGTPAPPSPAGPVPVEIRYPAGAIILTTTEV